jgi:beta-phosphoglucomutase-like phosphatase (HAD superfamily)
VIADTEQAHLAALRETLLALDVTIPDDEYMTTYLGYTDQGLLELLARHRGYDWSDERIQSIIRTKVGVYERLTSERDLVYPSAARCIERFAGARVTLAVASGAFPGEIDRILTRAGLRRHFRAIVGAGDYAEGKPSPHPYQEAARRIDVDPAAAVAIEDSMWGLDAARAAGCATIAVTNTYPRSALNATLIVDSLDEVTPETLDALRRS